MKKFTLFIATLMFSAMSFGTTKVSTLTFTAKCGGTGTASDGAAWTITSDAAESTWTENDGIHYGTGTKAVTYIKLVTNSIEGTISEIKVTCRNATGNGSSVAATVSVKVGGADFAALQTAPSPYKGELTFSGSAEGAIEILLSRDAAAINAMYVKSVVVTYEQAESFVAKPVITAKEYFINTTEVSISADDGMEIYYTLDGSDPDLAPGATSTELYSAPFQLASSATIKAVAKNPSTDVSSSVADKVCHKLELTSVAEANAITEKTDSVIALKSFMVQDVVVSGSNANIYIIDPLGAIIGASLIYDAGNTLGLAAGDVVDGFIGNTSPYHNLPELKPMVKSSELTIVHHGSGLEILNPTSWSLAPTAEVLNKYIKMENVTVEAGEFTTSAAAGLTANVASTDFTLYNQLRRAYTFEAGKSYDIWGYGAVRDDTYQVYFFSAEEHAGGGGTGIEDAAIEGKAVKVLRDGQIVILRNGKLYDLRGAEL